MTTGVRYDNETKQAAVSRVSSGEDIEAVAKELKIATVTIRKWKAMAKKKPRKTKAVAIVKAKLLPPAPNFAEAMILLRQARNESRSDHLKSRPFLLSMLALNSLEGGT